MKKMRLTESELVGVIKRIINEMEDDELNNIMSKIIDIIVEYSKDEKEELKKLSEYDLLLRFEDLIDGLKVDKFTKHKLNRLLSDYEHLLFGEQ